MGQRQARLLGEYLAQQRLSFAAFFTGGLERQKETARSIQAAYPDMPSPIVDPLWNEFDLTAVYDGIAPQLAETDAHFRTHYEAMQKAAADRTSQVHRQ